MQTSNSFPFLKKCLMQSRRHMPIFMLPFKRQVALRTQLWQEEKKNNKQINKIKSLPKKVNWCLIISLYSRIDICHRHFKVIYVRCIFIFKPNVVWATAAVQNKKPKKKNWKRQRKKNCITKWKQPRKYFTTLFVLLLLLVFLCAN